MSGYRNSRLYLMENIKLDMSYKNICDMSGETMREWAKAHSKWYYIDYNYLKHEQSIRIQAPYNQCLTTNYALIENPTNYYKGMYCFVTDAKYINDGVTELHFVLDEVRTYWDNVIPTPCFVEREHVINDEFGKYTLPEPFQTSAEWVKVSEQFENFSNLRYMLARTKEDVSAEDFKIINNLLVGVPISERPLLGSEVANTLADIINKGQEAKVVDLYSVPINDSTTISITLSESLDNGYVPKWKKCYTQQFNRVILTNLCGENKILAFERSGIPNKISCTIEKTVVPYCIILVSPTGYNTFAYDYNNAISLSDFPKVIWQGDSYKQWLANNQTSNILTTMSNALQGAIGLISAASGALTPAGALAIPAGLTMFANSVANQAQVINSYDVAQNQANQTHGFGNSAISLIAQNRYGVYLYQESQPEEYLKIIDQQFDLYGYRVDTIKIPALQTPGRKFNFVKTKNCAFTGNCPAKALEIINQIFDRGVHVWHNMDNILDWSI